MKIAIVGSSGNVGSATVRNLAHKGGVEVLACVRNPNTVKAQSLVSADNIKLVQASFDDVDSMVSMFKDVDNVFLVTPGAEDRTQLTLNGIEAAKKANVKYIVVVSVTTADLTDTKFGEQLKPVEEAVQSSGIDYTILRLPFFIDNLWASAETIRAGRLYAPVDPDAAFTPVAVEDVGEVAASLLTSPDGFKNTTLKLHSRPHSYSEYASTFSKKLGKEIQYVQVSFDDAKKAFMDLGMPEWQVDGVMELFKLFNTKSTVTNDPTEDIAKVVGRPPIDIAAWIAPVKHSFEVGRYISSV